MIRHVFVRILPRNILDKNTFVMFALTSNFILRPTKSKPNTAKRTLPAGIPPQLFSIRSLSELIAKNNEMRAKIKNQIQIILQNEHRKMNKQSLRVCTAAVWFNSPQQRHLPC